MRQVSVLGKTFTIAEARKLVEDTKAAIHRLGPPKPPEYEGPTGEELTGLIEGMVGRALNSLRRGDFPKNGVTTQFGVGLSEAGWTVQLSGSGEGLHLHAKTTEYGLNEDGETKPVEVPKAVLDAAARGLGLGEAWFGGCWTSKVSDEYRLPVSLRRAYKNYVPFKKDEGFEAFDKWFEEGL